MPDLRDRRFVLPVTAVMVAACLAIGSTVPAAETAPGTLVVTPATVTVPHGRFPQSLVVTRTSSDGVTADLTREAKFAAANPAVATVDERGRVFPVSAGTTTVTVTAGGASAVVAVTSQPVALPEGAASPPVSYQDEVQPILSKHRCNQGACHGYSLGKNGFKLSLRGADPAVDHHALTKEFFGRRIDSARPESSLLLTKPAGDVPHVGGVRFNRRHDSYMRLAQWIREGAPSDLGKMPELVGVSVFPESVVLAAPGSRMQLQVTARYADGSTRDVTPLAVFTSNAEVYAEVNDEGLVTMPHRGEAAITIRFERLFTVANLVCLGDSAGFAWSNPPERNLVDTHVFAKLRDLRINPSELTDDAEFARRVFLDLIGVQPTADELRAFLADASADKRDRLIESLFARPEFVDRWSLKWGDLLQNGRRSMSEESMYAFRDWLRHAVASNMPLDRFAREVLTGEGNPRDNATAAFYRVSASDPKVSMERTAQVFTGVRMLCARCHPHPFENWTQADYYGMTTFFNQVAEKPDVDDPQDRLIVVRHETTFAVNPRTNQPQPPRPLGAKDLTLAPNVDRRVAFAEWLTSKENPHFARSLVNRTWSYFFSRGIIDPVDDIRVTNPPVNPKLLDALTQDFVAHDFDLRHLMRTIVQSRTYQLSSRTNESNKHDLTNFSHAVPRRLSAEQLYDSVEVATGIRETIPGAPAGFRAAQGPDTNVTSEFLDLFGRAPRMEACECERTSDSNMLQALHMINGDTLLKRVTNPNARVAQIAKNEKLTPEQKVEELYLWTLCRRPTDQEQKVSLEHLKKYEQPLEAYQDLHWALLNSSDFLFVP